MTHEIALNLVDVHKSFGESQIIRGIDLAVEKGERHAIIGPNGAGKSTVFNLISGYYPLSDGKIELNDQVINGLEPFQINRLGLSRSFQVTNLFSRLSVFENVRCALLWSAGYKYSFWQLVGQQKQLNEKTKEIVDQFNMSHRSQTPVGELSYAEQRALEIGITVAGGAEVILLDEPTAGMSHSETEQAVDLMKFVSEGKTLVVVEHDMGVVFDLADRISVLVYGKIIATDTPDKIRSNKSVQEAYLGQLEEV
ncbi:MAG: ABC transporter ATP-binding protein [SAR324 cluster bacterium]|nr:ABC transporter ATP-binding protein [SAR324 cluster bacterium]